MGQFKYGIRRKRSAFWAQDQRKVNVFGLNFTGEMTFSQFRRLVPPLVIFYVSAAALIILSYFFEDHIIAEFAIIRGLEADLARQ